MKTRSESPFTAVSQTVRQTRATLGREFSEITRLEPRLSRLALNEAEALAWQSGFPLLVFPALAEEKIRALMAWRDYQASIRRVNPAPGSGARWQPEVARFHRNRRRGRMLTPTRSGRLASLAALMMSLQLLATGCNHDQASIRFENSEREAHRTVQLLVTKAISTEEAEARVARFNEAKAVLLAARDSFAHE